MGSPATFLGLAFPGSSWGNQALDRGKGGWQKMYAVHAARVQLTFSEPLPPWEKPCLGPTREGTTYICLTPLPPSRNVSYIFWRPPSTGG